jgi:hypothetical protein
MKNEIFSEWQRLGIYETAKNIGQQKYPTSNHFPQIVHGDGLVEMSIEEHEGMEDEHPTQYMRFSFDGNNLVIRSSQDQKPKLDLINIHPITGQQELSTTIQNLFHTQS